MATKDYLQFVTSKEEIRANLIRFNRLSPDDISLAQSIASRTWYWVFDGHMFAPNKFVAYKEWTFSRHANALPKPPNFYGAPFLGKPARIRVEAVLGVYKPDTKLSQQLVEWAERLLGLGMRTYSKEWAFALLL